VRALRKIGDEGAINALEQLKEDPESSVRNAVEKALAKLKSL